MGKKKAPAPSQVNGRFEPSGLNSSLTHAATVAFYGPSDKLATKVLVSVFLWQKGHPDFLERWFSKGDIDVPKKGILRAILPAVSLLADTTASPVSGFSKGESQKRIFTAEDFEGKAD